MTTPTQSAAALVRAYRDAPQYVDLTEHLETMLPQTLAALLELVEAQREALERAGNRLEHPAEQECDWKQAGPQYLECPDSDPEEVEAQWCESCCARAAADIIFSALALTEIPDEA